MELPKQSKLKQKNKKENFQECYWVLQDQVCQENFLAGKGMLRAGYGNKKGKGVVRAGSGNEMYF